MKEELQLKLVEILGSIQTAAGKAGDFAMAQLPDIAQSYVVYGRVKSAVVAVLLLVVGVILLSVARWAWKTPWNNSTWSFEKDHKRCDGNRMVIFFGTVLGSMAMAIAFLSFDYLVWFAPKVWLLKELANMIR